MKRKKSSGFTLIELLATISVLSLVSVIVIMVTINIIDDAKQKSFKVTIKETQTSAVSYVNENVNDGNWQTFNGNSQYKCISIQKLIDKGYFDSDIVGTEISDDIEIKADNNVMILKDNTTKSIISSELLLDSAADESYCGSIPEEDSAVEEVSGNIYLEIFPLGFANSKDVSVTYKLYNVSDEDVSDYTYSYSYEIDGEVFSERVAFDNDDDPSVENIEINITSNTNIYVDIKKDDTVITSDSIDVTSIDRVAPVIDLTRNSDTVVQYNITDVLSGLKAGNYEFNYLLTESNISSCSVLSSSSDSKEVTLAVNSNNVTGTIDLSGVSAGSYKLYYCSDGLKDNAGNIYNGIKYIDITIEEDKPDDDPQFSRGDYECTQNTTSMAMFSSQAGNMMSFVSNNMALLSANTPFCYLKHEYVDLANIESGSWTSDWPFVSAYVHKDYVDASKAPSENIEGDYVFGYIPLQNGGMCLTSLPCPGMAQFGIAQ